MWRIFGEDLMTSMCEGRDGKVVFRHDSSKVEVNNVAVIMEFVQMIHRMETSRKLKC